MFKQVLVIILVWYGLQVNAQTNVQVIEASSGDALPMANITFLPSNTNAVTDVNGQFQLPTNVTAFEVSYTGFLKQKVEVDQSEITVRLKEDFNQVQTTVVTAQSLPESVRAATHKIKVIDSKTFETRSINTLDQLLAEETGAQISNGGALGANISLMGIGGNNIKILKDGVPVVGRLDGELDLSQINLNDVERIEILEGPASVEFGTDALAGVINIITKTTTNNSVRFSSNARYESVGQYNIDLNAGASIDKHNFDVAVGRHFFDGFHPTATEREQLWAPKEQYFGNLKYGIQLNDRHLLKANYELYKEAIVDRRPITIDFESNEDGTIKQTAFGRTNYTNTLRHNGSIQHQFKIDTHTAVNSQLSFARYDRTRLQGETNLVTLEEQLFKNSSNTDTNTISEWNGNAIFGKMVHSKVKLSVGADFKTELFEGARILDDAHRQTNYAGFTTVKYLVNQNFQVQAGARYGYNTAFATPVTPAVHFKYQKQNWQTRLSYTRGFRAPSLKELYLFFDDNNHDVFGNPDLRPENAHSVQSSIDWSKQLKPAKQIKISNKLFYNLIDDQIALALTDVDNQVFEYFNLDQFQTFGLEHSTKLRLNDWKLGAGFQIVASKSNLTAVQQTDFFVTPNVNLSATYTHPEKGISVTLTHNYIGEQINYELNSNEIGISTLDAYQLMNFNISKSFLNNDLRLTVGAKNLLNVTNVNSSTTATGVHAGSNNAVATGINGFIALRYRFAKLLDGE